jgi:TolB-like protein/DNA-binding winged helix-turn-helix (wHTH) protein/Tfp pilus assembly protein PilF
VPSNAPASNRLRFDSFEVDLRSGELWKHGTRLRLQDQPFQVLRVLLERRGEIVTREELKQTLWPADTFVDFDDGLNTAVKKIRDVLGDSAEHPRYVETIPKRGYRFVGHAALAFPAHPAQPSAASPPQLVPAQAPPETTTPRQTTRSARYLALGVLSVALILTVLLASRWRSLPFGHSAVPRIESLAVLPLTNLSHDPEQDYFADGMTEALITNLAQVRALHVISRTSVMHYKSTNKTLPEIARDLNVDAVIEGAVQRSGNRVRVTAQLIHGQTDVHLWAKTFERDSQDVLVMQSDLAQAIASEIKVQLTAQEQQHLASARPVNPEAYNAYLLGNFHAAKRNPPAIAKAIDYFQQAIHIDPGYAQAYVGLANAYFESEIWSGVGIGNSRDQIRTATLKALELDGQLADVHELLARIHYQYDWDWQRTEAEFKRAIELNANLPSAYDHYAFFLQTMGRQQEALAAAHHAVELDPLSPWYLSEEGRILFRARQYESAIARYQRALELNPVYVPALTRMSDACEQLGKYDEALAFIQKWEQAIGKTDASRTRFAELYARMGKKREVIELLRPLEKNGALEADKLRTAVIYYSLGDKDRAIATLLSGAQSHSMMPFVFVDPRLDPSAPTPLSAIAPPRPPRFLMHLTVRAANFQL